MFKTWCEDDSFILFYFFDCFPAAFLPTQILPQFFLFLIFSLSAVCAIVFDQVIFCNNRFEVCNHHHCILCRVDFFRLSGYSCSRLFCWNVPFLISVSKKIWKTQICVFRGMLHACLQTLHLVFYFWISSWVECSMCFKKHVWRGLGDSCVVYLCAYLETSYKK